MDNSKNMFYQKKAKAYIPGMSQLLSKRPDIFSLGVWPGYYAKAKGAEVWDLDGNHYIDMSIAGIGANVLGYADEDVNAAVMDAVNNGSSSSLNCPEEVDLAEELCRLHPWAQKARFTRGGGEAMAVAVRIARAYTGRDKLVICGYHGWHDWYLAANIGTENTLGEHLLPGLRPTGVPKALSGTTLAFKYNDINSLKAIVTANKGELAAIIMEPVRNIQPLSGFLDEVKALARESGAVFIFDEISSGFRMNTGGAHILFNVTPDIAVFSKAMGNGYPIAAVIGRGEVMDAAQSSFISSTMWSERIGPVAALATIKKYEDKDVGKYLINIGKVVQDGWQSAANRTGIGIHISGIYPLSHFTFDGDNPLVKKAYFVQEMLAEGFLASNLFYPMFAHHQEHCNQYLINVEKVFANIVELENRGKLELSLKGQPSAAGFKRVT